MSLVAQFISLCNSNGSSFTYHRENGLTPCPCRTKQGFRDPVWHIQHPTEPVCNAEGFLPTAGEIVEFGAKGFIQPVQSGAVRRLTTEQLQELFGEITADDHVGMLPVVWQGNRLEFSDWTDSTADWLLYHGTYFTVVAANLIPDPSDGNPEHHWEVGLRKFSGPTLPEFIP